MGFISRFHVILYVFVVISVHIIEGNIYKILPILYISIINILVFQSFPNFFILYVFVLKSFQL